MGLITKEVEVRLCSANIRYYENLGYEIPRRPNQWGRIGVPIGATITVKVKDLPKGSSTQVNTNCDCCGREKMMKYGQYNKISHDGFTYCYDCTLTVLRTGEKSHRWNPNITDEERELGRNYPEYVDFIKRVMDRDNYTCQCCGQKHGDIEVHHMDGYDWCIEKRTDDTNGITLCHNCHGNFHSIYGYGDNTRGQFEEWFGKAVEFVKYNGALSSKRQIYDYEAGVIYDGIDDGAEQLNANPSCVYKCCQQHVEQIELARNSDPQNPHKIKAYTVKGRHLFWLDKYENMTKEEIKAILDFENNRYKKVFCITTKELFNSASLASKKYEIGSSAITNACLGKSKSSGKLPDGTKLQWMYYEDFLKLPQEEQNEILARNKDSSNDGSFVIHK